jgi:methyl-accepting chemotaxis protein
MKIRYKLSVCVIVIMVIMALGINIFLFRKAAAASYNLGFQSLEHLTSFQTEFWQNRQNYYIQTLYTLSNVMGDYESIKAGERRERYDDMLKSAMEAESQIITMYTVWKPNAIDGMDTRFIDRAGSTQAGQYAISFSRNAGKIEGKTSGDIDDVMAHINGPNARKDRVYDPVVQKINGQNLFIIRMEVPIFNLRTCEVTGGLGCFIIFDNLQQIAEKTMKANNEIAMMALYSGNGIILAHSKPNRVGKRIFDADVEFGGCEKLMEAVRNGETYKDTFYDPMLNDKIIFVMKPFLTGDPDNSWSMLIGVSESFVLKEASAIAGTTAVLSIIAILAAAVIFYIVIRFITKPIVKVADRLNDNCNGKGDLNRLIHEKGNEKVANMLKIFNKNSGKTKRSLGIPVHTGGITMFPMLARYTREQQKFIFTNPLYDEIKESLTEENKHIVPISTISDIFFNR